MSKSEVAALKTLLARWQEDKSSSAEDDLLRFLDMYHQSIVSALEFAAR